MTVALLDLRDVSVSYGKNEAVRGVSLSVAAGSIVTVIGANGAGKSTLLNATMGLLRADGHLAFDGADLHNRPAEERVAAGMSLVPDSRDLFSTMTVEDNLRLGGFRTGSAAAVSLAGVYVRFPRLQERRRQLARTLSGGEQQMLAMGRALMAKPRLLMLDEPSLGLAPLIVREIFSIITDLRAAGVAILLVEQNARAALQVADHGYVMELGEIVLQGSAAQLAADPRVVESYLGLATAGAEPDPA